MRSDGVPLFCFERDNIDICKYTPPFLARSI